MCCVGAGADFLAVLEGMRKHVHVCGKFRSAVSSGPFLTIQVYIYLT